MLIRASKTARSSPGSSSSAWSRTAGATYRTVTCEHASQTSRASPAVMVVIVELCEQPQRIRLNSSTCLPTENTRGQTSRSGVGCQGMEWVA